MKKAIYKVPNGKLLKIFVDDDGGSIVSVKITGDFFMHPEENIELLEATLVGSPLNQEDLHGRITDFLSAHPTTLFGVDTDSLVLTILNAASQPS